MVAETVDPTDEAGGSARSLWESTPDALSRVGVAVAIAAVGWLVGRKVRRLPAVDRTDTSPTTYPDQVRR